MKKILNAPVVCIDRFEAADLIVTSDPIVDPNGTNVTPSGISGRQSIWD